MRRSRRRCQGVSCRAVRHCAILRGGISGNSVVHLAAIVRLSLLVNLSNSPINALNQLCHASQSHIQQLSDKNANTKIEICLSDTIKIAALPSFLLLWPKSHVATTSSLPLPLHKPENIPSCRYRGSSRDLTNPPFISKC